MESTKECKILFNTLIQRMWKENQDDPQVDNPLYLIQDIVTYIMKQGKTKRFFDLKRDNKFCFLESATIKETKNAPTLITGFFKSARSEFRPDLINRRTGLERKNPKEISEGDIEKTHFIIKIDKREKEVYFFLEYNFHGVTVNNAVNYFSAFYTKYLTTNDLKKNSSIKHYVIARNNFLTELERLSRTRLAEIYFDKHLLGSKALNFSDRLVSLKKDLKLVASASTQESITEIGIDFFNALNNRRSDVSKVRIYGNDENNNEIVLDTSFTGRVEFISVDINQETGDVNSSQLFTGLKKIANSF